MNFKVLVGGLIGAFLGAIIWAAISSATGYEVGYVAWGIGLLVGYCAKLAGGNGSAAGVVCAALALVSIFGGKILSAQYSVEGELRKVVEEGVTQAYYDELIGDAADFSDVTSEQEYAAFMVAHDYTDSDTPENVSAEELADFKANWVNTLREMQADPLPYEQWREQHIKATIDSVMAQASMTELVIQDLGLFDAVFALLGLATAYKVAEGSEA